MSPSKRCQGKTKLGKRCKNKVKNDKSESYCHLHKSNNFNEIESDYEDLDLELKSL